MFLKTLTIKGFKSFAETTTLAMEPGVTVVVGPNGSGKSNVVDAIGWVLGAQAPSAVRSQKMDDVIFAGTASRPALGRAEVSLTIDNSSGLLDVELAEVSVTRTLFRSGDSEYALNGVPCRLLDIQDLLSDSGVGRQQHVIISQGQIDAVLNARPEDRRLVIEEAAGVLKFRRRKEKAERRLAATEANLTRLQDLLREVRRNLRPLERQADAARRHGAVVTELTALRIHLAGQELTRLQARQASGLQRKADLSQQDTALRKTLSELDTAVLAAEARLSALGGFDLGDALTLLESLRERARGLAALLAERRRGIDRDRGATVDQAVVASLEAEAARLDAELVEVAEVADALVPEQQRLAAAERAMAEARADHERRWTDEQPVPDGRAAEARGELAALRAGIERGGGEAERVAERLAGLDERLAGLERESQELRTSLGAVDRDEAPLLVGLETAEAARAAAEARSASAEQVRRAAEGEQHRWTARAEALTQALDEARARAGAERLGELDGVVGTMLDLVQVDEGWERAFEAAAAEAIAAVVVADVATARRAIDALRSGGLSGAVLALGSVGDVRARADRSADHVRAHVRGDRPEVEALLDALIGDVVAVGGWTEALDAHLRDPARLVVTSDGDRFGPAGWRVGAARSGANRAALDEAVRRSERAAGDLATADDELAHARRALDVARAAEAAAAQALDEHDAAMRATGDALERVERSRRDAGAEAEALREHLGELRERLDRERAEEQDLAGRLPVLEAAEAELAERGRAMGESRDRLTEQAAMVGSARRDLEVRRAALDERRQLLERRRHEVEQRLERHQTERAQAAVRRVQLDRRQVATERLARLVDEQLAVADERLTVLREQRRRQSEAARAVSAELDGLRAERADAERTLGGLREQLQRAELDEAEVRMKIEVAVETARRDLDVEPSAAMAAPAPELSEGTTAAARVRELERDLRLMGPINPLALEEFEALEERHQFLSDQLDDVKAGRRDLAKVIRAVDTEIVEVFSAAYADVAANFAELFQTLFPGGQGKLKLTDPDDLLNTGVEVEARPSGKNVRKLSLLSGGERSLTALAYLFAVFRARPSPFYVMDEVEAALDDVNLHRFLDLVAEFRAEAQLIIVSHQKRTMEAADCLYGVSMRPGGSSRVISEKVATAP